MRSNYLPTEYQEFIHLSRYSRWIPEKGRRETWEETVSRYFDFFTEHLQEQNDFELDEVSRAESNKVNAMLSKVLGNINFTHFYAQKGGSYTSSITLLEVGA